jgi:hypothetical protein
LILNWKLILSAAATTAGSRTEASLRLPYEDRYSSIKIMRKYDEQYYFIDKADDDSLPSLTPDINTENRRFRYEKQKIGSPPLMFFNGAKECQQKLHIASSKVLPEILFSG